MKTNKGYTYQIKKMSVGIKLSLVTIFNPEGKCIHYKLKYRSHNMRYLKEKIVYLINIDKDKNIIKENKNPTDNLIVNK